MLDSLDSSKMCITKWNQLSLVRRERRRKADHGLDCYRELSRLSIDCMRGKRMESRVFVNIVKVLIAVS